MVNYESSLRQRDLGSLMLKRQVPPTVTVTNDRYPHSNKLVNTTNTNEADRDRDRLRGSYGGYYGKSYSVGRGDEQQPNNANSYYTSYHDSTNGLAKMHATQYRPPLGSGNFNNRVNLSPGRSPIRGASSSSGFYNENLTSRGEDPAYANQRDMMSSQRSAVSKSDRYNYDNYHDSPRHKMMVANERIVESRLEEPPQPPPQAPNEIQRPSKREVDRTDLTRMRKKYKNKISANVSGTKFEIVKQVLVSMGCRIVPDENFDCNLIWDDTRVSIEGISELKAFQRYNHFPAMSEISKKDALARNISKIGKLLPKDFDFVPRTWIMPTEYSQLVAYSLDAKKIAFAQQKQNKTTFIMKPANGAMGHGIKLFRNVEKIQPNDNFIVQEYIPNPYLIDGFKFDLRIYALVTSCDPLRAFIYNNGLVRLGTEPYQEPHESNIDHLYMHLTNYSVNKRNRDYDEGDEMGEKGTKRSLKFLFEHLRRNNIDSSKVWRNIQDIILKTLLVAEPYLFHTYKMCRPGQIPGTESVCFEILGFDILLDDKMKPWVLEVNRCPSFGANQQIDFDIKSKLLYDSFELLHLRASDRSRCQVMEKIQSKRRLYNLNSYSSRPEATSSSMNNYETHKPIIHSFSMSNLGSSSAISKKHKTKERRKSELIDQIKLMRREQKRQDYENRNLGNYSRLFPKNEKTEMDYYLNILNTAFNLFYPVGKHLQWRKTYEKIKEDELLMELAECDDAAFDLNDYDKVKKINEYLRDDYMSTESDDSRDSSSDDEAYESRHGHGHHGGHHGGRDDQRYRDHFYYDQRHGSDGHHAHDSYHDQQENNRWSSLSNSRMRENDELEENNEMMMMSQQKRSSKETNKSLIEQQAIKANRVETLIKAMLPSTSTTASTLSSTNKSSSSSLRMLTRYVNGGPTTTTAKRSESNVNLSTNDENTSRLAESFISEIRSHQAKQSAAAAVAALSATPFASSSSTSSSSSSTSTTNQSLGSLRQSNRGAEGMAKNDDLAALNVAVLKLLSQLEIKYPGKTNEETRALLHKIYSKFEVFKPKLANYWMAKLDDNKRAKILNIVKSNVMAILRKVFMIEPVENLRLYKIFVKLINRLLWMHGQGLWNCFISANNSSWESIFSKSSFQITESEFKCCLRIVQLCKDCVLIVYQYAFEQNPKQNPKMSSSSLDMNSSRMLRSRVNLKAEEMKNF